MKRRSFQERFRNKLPIRNNLEEENVVNGDNLTLSSIWNTSSKAYEFWGIIPMDEGQDNQIMQIFFAKRFSYSDQIESRGLVYRMLPSHLVSMEWHHVDKIFWL